MCPEKVCVKDDMVSPRNMLPVCKSELYGCRLEYLPAASKSHIVHPFLPLPSFLTVWERDERGPPVSSQTATSDGPRDNVKMTHFLTPLEGEGADGKRTVGRSPVPHGWKNVSGKGGAANREGRNFSISVLSPPANHQNALLFFSH